MSNQHRAEAEEERMGKLLDDALSGPQPIASGRQCPQCGMPHATLWSSADGSTRYSCDNCFAGVGDHLPWPWETPTKKLPSDRRAQRVTVCDRTRFGHITSEMDYYAAHGRMRGSVSTGMRRLDGMLLGGFRPGMFYVLGGESGKGKSTLLVQWAFAAAEQLPDSVVGIVTPEMSADSLDVRSYSQISAHPLGRYRRDPDATRSLWASLSPPQNVRASFDAEDIEPFVQDEQPAIFIVDYAQQAVSYGEQQRYTALAALGARCLDICKTRNIPVIIGSQVNVDKDREFSIRETKILEHQADVVIYIDVQFERGSFDASGHPLMKPGSHLRVTKHRHGPSGKVPVHWRRELYRFDEETSEYGGMEL